MESKLSSAKKDGTLWETEEQALRYELIGCNLSVCIYVCTVCMYVCMYVC